MNHKRMWKKLFKRLTNAGMDESYYSGSNSFTLILRLIKQIEKEDKEEMIRRIKAKLQRIAEIGKVRDLYHCPLYGRKLKVPCSYPTKFKCEGIFYVNDKNTYMLCRWQVEELGLETCIKQAEALVEWNGCN